MATNDRLKAKGYVPASGIAEKLGKHVTTIYRWIDAGVIDGIRVGKLRYVSLQSLFDYLGEEAVETFELKEGKYW